MFCNNCGNELNENAKFCDKCGALVGGEAPASNGTAAAPVQKNGNPILENTIATFKGFFSKNTVKTVGESAKSQGMEWTIIELISLLIYSLALGVNANQIVGAIGKLFDESGSDPFPVNPFGYFFPCGLIIGIVTFFLMSVCIFVAAKLVFKLQISMINVFNLVATASLPLTVAYLLNMLFGFLWVPFIVVFSIPALIATAILLYVGIQKLGKIEKSPYLAYVIIWIIVVTITMIVVAIAGAITINNMMAAVDKAVNSMMGNDIGGIFSGMF